MSSDVGHAKSVHWKIKAIEYSGHYVWYDSLDSYCVLGRLTNSQRTNPREYLSMSGARDRFRGQSVFHVEESKGWFLPKSRTLDSMKNSPVVREAGNPWSTWSTLTQIRKVLAIDVTFSTGFILFKILDFVWGDVQSPKHVSTRLLFPP